MTCGPYEPGGTFRWNNIHCAPIVHSRYYFALWIRDLFEELQPELVAVEFPPSLKDAVCQGVRRLPFLSVACSSLGEEDYSYVPIDPCDALIETVRSALEAGIPVHFIDLDRLDPNDPDLHYTPDDYVLPRIGPEAYYRMTSSRTPVSRENSIHYLRESHMAARLRQINAFERRTLFACGLLHWPRILEFLQTGKGVEYFDLEDPDREIFLANLHPDSAKEALEEIPAIAGRYNSARIAGSMDRNAETARIIDRAIQTSQTQFSPARKKALDKYLANLARLSLQFTPDMVDLLTAAKNVGGDEFAFHVMETAQTYPFGKEEEEGLPTIRIRRTFKEADEGRMGLKSIRLRRRGDMTWKRNMKSVRLKKRPGERFKGEWRQTWDKSGEHCSYPPEDILLEDYNQFIRGRIVKMLSEEKARVEEFSTSFQDGVDLRETVRNWHTGKIYVRCVPAPRGKVGSVAIAFDEENPGRYPWRTVWYSEHKNESDLIMYTTEPGNRLIGPGISQCRFGGYASIFPPRRIVNLWFYYDRLAAEGLVRNEADLVLYSAIVYSDEKYVGYVAGSPPSARLRRFAEENGRRVVYVPLTALSPESVARLQRFHVLGAKRIRRFAHKYIL